MLAAHEKLRDGLPDALLLLVPRHPERFEAVADLLRRRQVSFTRRSGAGGGSNGTSGGRGGTSGGTIGGGSDTGAAAPAAARRSARLKSCWWTRWGSSSRCMLYSGRCGPSSAEAWCPIGGHNLLEPAALGLPVLTGPHHFNGKDIARLMLDQGAALQVGNAQEVGGGLGAAAGRSAGTPAGSSGAIRPAHRRVESRQRGAIARTH